MSVLDTPPVWRNRDFRLFWAGLTLSEVGNGLSHLAYPLLMLAITDSPVAAGVLSAARALPYLLVGLIAGALADRWNRKVTMVVCDLARAVNMASIPIALAFGVLTPAQLFVNGFLGGTLYVFHSAAEGTCLPNIVSRQQLTSAIAAQKTSQFASGVVSGPIGGALLQVSRALPFVVDAITFLVSALCMLSVRSRLREDTEDTEDTAEAGKGTSTLRAEIVEGVLWLWRHGPLRLIAVTAAGLQVAISGIGLVAIIRAQDAGASDALIGVLFSALGIGGVVGAIAAPRLSTRLGLGGMLLSVLWFQGLLWVLLAFAGNVVTISVTLALFSFTMPCFGIAALNYQMAVTPDRLRGRVGTAFNLLIWAATPVGYAVAGVLLDVFSPRDTSWMFAAWVALVATAGGGLRGLNNEQTAGVQQKQLDTAAVNRDHDSH